MNIYENKNYSRKIDSAGITTTVVHKTNVYFLLSNRIGKKDFDIIYIRPGSTDIHFVFVIYHQPLVPFWINNAHWGRAYFIGDLVVIRQRR